MDDVPTMLVRLVSCTAFTSYSRSASWRPNRKFAILIEVCPKCECENHAKVWFPPIELLPNTCGSILYIYEWFFNA